MLTLAHVPHRGGLVVAAAGTSPIVVDDGGISVPHGDGLTGHARASAAASAATGSLARSAAAPTSKRQRVSGGGRSADLHSLGSDTASAVWGDGAASAGVRVVLPHPRPVAPLGGSGEPALAPDGAAAGAAGESRYGLLGKPPPGHHPSARGGSGRLSAGAAAAMEAVRARCPQLYSRAVGTGLQAAAGPAASRARRRTSLGGEGGRGRGGGGGGSDDDGGEAIDELDDEDEERGGAAGVPAARLSRGAASAAVAGPLDFGRLSQPQLRVAQAPPLQAAPPPPSLPLRMAAHHPAHVRSDGVASHPAPPGRPPPAAAAARGDEHGDVLDATDAPATGTTGAAVGVFAAAAAALGVDLDAGVVAAAGRYGSSAAAVAAGQPREGGGGEGGNGTAAWAPAATSQQQQQQQQSVHGGPLHQALTVGHHFTASAAAAAAAPTSGRLHFERPPPGTATSAAFAPAPPRGRLSVHAQTLVRSGSGVEEADAEGDDVPGSGTGGGVGSSGGRAAAADDIEDVIDEEGEEAAVPRGGEPGGCGGGGDGGGGGLGGQLRSQFRLGAGGVPAKAPAE